jgi:hypothetical protein
MDGAYKGIGINVPRSICPWLQDWTDTNSAIPGRQGLHPFGVIVGTAHLSDDALAINNDGGTTSCA